MPSGAANTPEGPSALVGSRSPGATLPRVATITFKLPSEALDDVLAHPWDNASTQLSCPSDAVAVVSPGVLAKTSLHS